jgi:endonuclease/exonuclease/phosphatase family metal-dependent hydrolase
MRLLSLNTAIFEANNEPVKDFLIKQKADILCLQEVTKPIDKSANREFISKTSIDCATENLKYEFFNPITILKDFQVNNFHKKKSFSFDFGGFIEMGNYMRTKFEIIKKEHQYVKNTGNIKTTDWKNWPKCFSTGVQIADLRLPQSKMLRVINYHGIWTKEKVGNPETLKACKKILSLAKGANYPTIIAGDFNLFPDTPSMKIFYKDFISLVDEFSIITTRPQNNELSNLDRNVVDYILVSKDITVKSFNVPDLNISDHLPLVLDFDLR